MTEISLTGVGVSWGRGCLVLFVPMGWKFLIKKRLGRTNATCLHYALWWITETAVVIIDCGACSWIHSFGPRKSGGLGLEFFLKLEFVTNDKCKLKKLGTNRLGPGFPETWHPLWIFLFLSLMPLYKVIVCNIRPTWGTLFTREPTQFTKAILNLEPDDSKIQNFIFKTLHHMVQTN